MIQIFDKGLVQIMTTQFTEDGFIKEAIQKGKFTKTYHLPKTGLERPYLSKLQLHDDMADKPMLVMEDSEFANFIGHHTDVTVRDNKTAKQDIEKFPKILQEHIHKNPTMMVSEVSASNGKRRKSCYMGFIRKEAA